MGGDETLVTTMGLLKETRVAVKFWNLNWNPLSSRRGLPQSTGGSSY